ncbi:CgeB family protein [Calothrix sp. UHCC 0171]|uniref:CgeB family protein n=1 Tax=Calothrix sp. UHCC 0171 TaxID=3110245 RepID=UPI002B21006F|nr:DUF3880 domain-containing protein [Calothrix sp. UHCC 0171]MEA5569983.1 DUF3880 domain-containing protein [Calothrix sp. UHCC 0171]
MSKRILIYNSKVNNNNFHLISSLWQALSKISGIDVRISNSQSIRVFVKSFEPEIIVFLGGEDVTFDVIQTLKNSSSKWILWTTEDPFEIKRNKEISKYFDFVFTSDKASKELYQHPNCYYLPLAADSSWFFHPVIEQPKELLYDLIFIGTAWPNRTKFLQDLTDLLKYNNLKSRFILPTNPYIPSDNLSTINICKFERDFRVAPRDLAKLQNYSRFALTLFRDFSGDGNARPQSSPTNRFYETSLAGTCQIIVSNNMTIKEFHPEIEQYIFQCQDAQEVIKTIIWAKTNPEMRNSAASEMQKFVLENHSYLHRAKELLNIIDNSDK